MKSFIISFLLLISNINAAEFTIQVGGKSNFKDIINFNDGDKFDIFGKGGGDALADQFSIPLLGKIPISEGTNDIADDGTPLINQDNDTPTKSAIEKLITVIAEKLPPIVDETCTGRLAKVFEELSK